jgi:hypothetical protein
MMTIAVHSMPDRDSIVGGAWGDGEFEAIASRAFVGVDLKGRRVSWLSGTPLWGYRRGDRLFARPKVDNGRVCRVSALDLRRTDKDESEIEKAMRECAADPGDEEKEKKYRKLSQEESKSWREMMKETYDKLEADRRASPLACPRCRSKSTNPTKCFDGGFTWNCRDCSHIWHTE